MVSSSDGLHAAKAFYDQGGKDTRERVKLHDVSFACVVSGDDDAVKAMAELFASRLADEAGVSEVVYAVVNR